MKPQAEHFSDIVVAGAGPAGLAAAIALGRSGWKVLVIERRLLPVDKTCGEGIMPPGVAILRQLDIARRIDPSGLHPFEGIEYRTRDGEVASSSFAEGPGWGVRRTCLSRALSEAAKSDPNIEIRENASVDGFRVDDSEVQVRCGEETFTCRLLIGADGLHSRIRHMSGLGGAAAARSRLGTRCHFNLPPWNPFVEVHTCPGMEAYVTPCGPGQVGVSILWEKRDDATSGMTPMKRFEHLVAKFPALRDRLADAEPSGEPMSTGPLEQKAVDCIADGVALIGDAAGYLDACTGEGITLGFKQAMALASVLTPLRENPPPMVSRHALRDYRKQVRSITRPYYLGTRLMMSVSRRPRLMARFVLAMRNRPDRLQRLFSFHMGNLTFRQGIAGMAGAGIFTLLCRPRHSP